MDRAAVTRSVVLALVVVAALSVGAAGTTTGPADGGQQTTDRALGLPADVDPDSVLLSVDIQPDGDAQWRVEYRVYLDNQNETDAFESLQSDIERNESEYVRDFAGGIRSTVGNAENATGREMSASNFTVNAQIKQLPQKHGAVTYTFTWDNFAVVEGNQIQAGDALSGFFIDSETSLLFSYPENYGVVSVSPEPTERRANAVVWTGRLDFSSGEPQLVVAESAGTTTDTSPATSGTREGPIQDGPSTVIPLIVGGLSVVLLLAAALYIYLQRGDLAARTEREGAEVGAEAGGGGGATGAGGAMAGETEEEDADAESGPPEELLSNEERVKRFLREQGGRAKQQEVVDAMGWTEAKTSQVVKKMREGDELESFRIGRENVLKLPEEGEDGDGESEGL